MKIHPYLNFDGRTEEAMRFYADVLRGELSEIHRFGGMPGDVPAALKDRVMHVGIELPDGQRIMASDTMPGMGPDPVAGNTFSISINPDSRAEADRIFAALAAGGHVGMPLEDQFWGDYYGHLTDRFGVQWMLNFSAQRG